MKRFLFFLSVLTLGLPLFGAESVLNPDEQPWRLMEQAHLAFSRQEYGAALRLANQAKENKEREYTRYASLIRNELRVAQVRRAGDNIQSVLAVLKEREAAAAAAAITGFLDRYGEDFFNNSLTSLLAHIEAAGVLPEAEDLIADVYLTEGEYALAKTYYQTAWSHAHALDIPDAQYDILYKLAHVGDLMEDDELYEQSLLLVLSGDPYARGFQDGSGTFIRALKRAVEKKFDGDAFFSRYRADTYRALKAYLFLARFYRKQNEYDQYFAMAALGALTAFTRIDAALENRELEYEFRNLEDFFIRANRHEEIRTWMEKNRVGELFDLFYNASEKKITKLP